MWLNYHHLHYFWTVAREGSLARASEQLRLAPPTLSTQIHALEETLGGKLFQRAGRRMVLTDFGQMVLQYADEIFAAGRELVAAVEGRPMSRPPRLTIGVNESLPKIAVHQLIQPAMEMQEPPRLVCREGRPEELMAALVTHELDLVLSDGPPPPDVRVKVFHHLLTECEVGLFAAPKLAAALRRKFPGSLDGVPMLMPWRGSELSRALEHWLEECKVRPQIAGEFQDSGLMKAFGQRGLGVFPAPMSVEAALRQNYRVVLAGVAGEVRERVYAISAERRFAHPGVVAIMKAAARR